MIVAVLSGFGLALSAPWLHYRLRRGAGWLLALLPVALTAYFAAQLPHLVEGETLAETVTWIPSLGIDLAFYLDGLGVTFALLISGIGALVLLYASAYLAEDPLLGRFYLYLLIFMASMLGVVLANNLITLFVFWELTSISSYLLIGFNHEQSSSRAAALQALLVTGGGGLAMLAGLVLLGQVTDTYTLSALAATGEHVRASDLYPAILALVLVGAFAKSAQFPFHFWLPNAMEAPTPVSAYLHSATMVKAGVYLLARLSPVLGGTAAWQGAVIAVGAATMLLGAYLAWQQVDLKRILAYSTISALGMLVLLLGIGGALATKAAMTVLVAHSLYKGALFLAAGALDHETGTRDVTQLGDLWRAMPVTGAAAILAGASMAGLPPLFGFVAKEVFYKAAYDAPDLSVLLTALAVLSSVLIVAAAGLVAIKPFFGARVATPRRPHEAPLRLWLGPLSLAALSVFFGLQPSLVAEYAVKPATAAVLAAPAKVELVLWPGINTVLLLSLLTLALGTAVYFWRGALIPWARRLDLGGRVGPLRGYGQALDGLLWLADRQTRILQNGYLRFYLITIVATTVALVGYAALIQTDLGGVLRAPEMRVYEAAIVAVILAATAAVTRARSRLAAVVSLGTVGYGVALLYILFGAPDLAMTQFAVETLTVFLFVLVIYRLPRFATLTSRAERWRDAVVALSAGAMMTLLVLIVTADPSRTHVASFFADNSVTLAKGRNIVNVILVDFRGLDTLGEITVLAVAAAGVFALLKLRPAHGPSRQEQTAPVHTQELPALTATPVETDPAAGD
ncbi:MAG: putative monovalent cation/H+ antiporter subunit A [Aggregatilineaceae bacterium]